MDIAVQADQPKTPEPIGWSSMLNGMSYVTLALPTIFYLAFSYGAAKLSYDKYRSIGWAIVAFIFSTFYYPYYALVLNAPSALVVGAFRLRR